MGWVSGIVVYILFWWLIFFTMLPIGVTAQRDGDQAMVPGTAESAPLKPRLWWKAFATSILAGVVFLGFYYTLEHQWFGLFGDYFVTAPPS